MMTKGLNIESITKFVKMLDMKHQEGRAELAPELSQAINTQRCVRFNSEISTITKVSRTTKKIPKCEINIMLRNIDRDIDKGFVCPTPHICECRNIQLACDSYDR